MALSHQQQRKFKNPYFPKATRTFWHNDGWVYICIVVFIFGLLMYAVQSRNWWYIEYITVSGNQYISVEDIAQPAREALLKKRWFVLPQQFYLFASTEDIEAHLHESLDNKFAIEEISVSKNFPNEVLVVIKERIPGLVYITSNNQYYYLDGSGIVTEQVAGPDAIDPHFPRVRDHNPRTIQVSDQVVSPEIVSAIEDLNASFTTTTGLNISEYSIQEIQCYKKEYVAEKIFADEIQGTVNEEIKFQKMDILERLEEGEISVDQSLDLLEEVKLSELEESDEVTESGNEGFLQLAAQFKDTDCAYVSVIQDIGVVTNEGPEIYFNANIDTSVQLTNLQTIITKKIEDLTKVKYIDVRFQDRAYYR